MSDNKLIPCVCGGEAENSIFLKREDNKLACDLFAKRCNGDNCLCETPTYATEAACAEAWNAMQTALQAGWTSEVPSEAGEWWFIGEVSIPERETYTYFEPTHASIDDDMLVYLKYVATPIKNCNGIWFPANYPQPPQDTDQLKKEVGAFVNFALDTSDMTDEEIKKELEADGIDVDKFTSKIDDMVRNNLQDTDNGKD